MKEKNITARDVLLTGVSAIAIGGIVGLTAAAIFASAYNLKTKEGTIQPTETTIEETKLIDVINGDIEVGTPKTFEPGEHYISVRMPQTWNPFENGSITGLAVNNIPEGYDIYQINPYTEKVGYGSATGGYDIWFVNTETVEVTATYNEYYDTNGYYTFGTVVEEKVLTK